MNPIALWLASGESLYVGMGVMILVVGWSWWVRNRWMVRLRNLLAWVGMAMVVLACGPFSWWVYAALVGLFVGWFWGWNVSKVGRREQVLRVGFAAGLVGVLLVMVLMELPYRKLRAAEGVRADHLVVIGGFDFGWDWGEDGAVAGGV